MGKRYVQLDPDKARQDKYSKLDRDALSAIWETISTLSASGVDVGPKAIAMLNARQLIKESAPKD
tara:strand:- start:286 stop:480 length:195 start_codon:yes stop_codon:yes gene_type:complete